MQRDEQLMTADNDFLIKEMAEDLVLAKHSNDTEYEKELCKEVIEDLLELVSRKNND